MTTTNSSEYPKHPLPKHPLPEPREPAELQQPMVYVYESSPWEYKVVAKQKADQMPSEEELNAMGKSGWELVGVATLPDAVNFFFKRMRP